VNASLRAFLRPKPRYGLHYIYVGGRKVRVPRKVQRWWEFNARLFGRSCHTHSHYPEKS
jgi:hypothetical protein